MKIEELVKECRIELREVVCACKRGREDVALACLDRVRHIIDRELKEKGR